ncbi:MAG: RNA 2'-phosphotransferase [Candidatus Lokiarchaeota archaeon]|nr:RNA 2'-phosphotransferase [Candidatus Lokiarchaeota archaeon]
MNKLEISISKTISYILRHHPEEFNIQLDSEGFVNLQDILMILNKKYENIKITKEFVENINRISDKKRFEIEENKIRAIYGHSIKKKIEIPEVLDPPNELFHGTSEKAYLSIKQIGLKKQKRQYVHLSDDIKTAITVGMRREKRPPIVLIIDVKKARESDIKFYKSGEIYLADYIPPEFISIYKNNK